MKKLIVSLFLMTALVAVAQTTTIQYRFMPLLSGYNVYVPTNVTSVGYGTTNVEFTAYNGQILYSLTNNVINGTVNTNLVAPDAFKLAELVPDANGDVVSNAVLVVAIGNTNLIPIAITNIQGQWFTPTLYYTTNYSTAAWATTWPLASSSIPWMYPATTNVYPFITNNLVIWTIHLYRAPAMTPDGSTTGASYPWWETTAQYTYLYTNADSYTPSVTYVPLPTWFMQGAKKVYATVGTTTGTYLSKGGLLNQLGILQPQP